ncbi:hypothetical protein MYOV066v1_p0072 [Vibrio phage PS15B.3]|nr:hypothetical protein MYOV066v1_p0072 [Vibrio phage PS15B.3]
MKFPLILSCGHTTRKSLADPIDCGCDVQSQYQSNGETPIDKALVEFQGQWRTVLENYSVKLPNNKKHGACPVCGGKDRFRFDDKNGLGTWYCSQCPEQSGGGLKLLSMYLGKTTMATAKELIGDDLHRSTAPKRIHTVNHDEVRAANIELAKKGAKLMLDAAKQSTHGYMDNKGLFGEWLVNGEPMMSREGITPVGDLLLVPVYKANKQGVTELVNIQKITRDGVKRPLFGGDMQGVHHVIDGATKNIAIVEGFATGVTINQATKWKCYVSFNTGNLAAAVKQAKADHQEANIIIFGDHDKLDEKHNRRPGEYYANEAAAAYGAGVVIPDMDIETTGDWDDYRQKHGMDNLKATLRDMVKKELAAIKPVTPKTEPTPKPTPEAQPVNVESTPEAKEEPVKAAFVAPVEQAPQAPAPAFGSWMNAAPAPKPVNAPKTVEDLPDGVCIDHIDVDAPPAIAGDIVKYMKSGAHRELEGGAYTAMALQCLAMAGAGISGFMGTKTSMITIILGLSAGGKEWPQKVIKEILADSGIKVYGDIRSDKDIIRSAVYDNGRCFYIKDEAHSLLAATSKQEKHSANIPATLMELATTSIMPISRLHLDEFQGQMMHRIGRLEKQVLAKEDIKLGYHPEIEKPKIEKAEAELEKIHVEINKLQGMMDGLDSGIKDPCLNLIALSTPKKLAAIIDEDAIESGFLGRGFIFDCGSERSHRNFTLWGKKSHDERQTAIELQKLKARIGAIAQMASDTSQKKIDAEFNGQEYTMTASDSAYKLMYEISRHYDQYHYINHTRLGAIYARLPERVMSVASILALDNLKGGQLVIEEEHVLYALKLGLSSIDHLSSNLKVNEAVDGATVEDKLEGIKEAIIKRLSVSKKDERDGWRYKSELKNYLKRQKYYQEISKELLEHGQDAMENALAVLMGEGRVIRNPENDKQVKRKWP